MTAPAAIAALQPAVVFVNASSGAGRARSFLPGIRQAFRAAAVGADFVTTGSAEELQSAARAALEDQRRLLFAVGGDGTFQALVNATYGAEVVLGVVPAGGGNDFADALGLPDDPVEATKALLGGTVQCVDLAKARTADGRERFYIAGGGVGLDAQAARFAAGAFRHLPGRSRYIVSALRALWSYRAVEVHLEFPESDLPPVETKALLAAVLNAQSYGAGVRLAPEAAIDDGWLDLVIVEGMSRASALRLLPGLLHNGDLHTSRIQRTKIRKVHLSTVAPCFFHGDGEILGPTPVEIDVVARATKVLAPTQIGGSVSHGRKYFP